VYVPRTIRDSLYVEDRGSGFLRNLGEYLRNYMLKAAILITCIVTNVNSFYWSLAGSEGLETKQTLMPQA
jgi:hypothetical protein